MRDIEELFIKVGSKGNPTREAGVSIKPGVERSGTPGRIEGMIRAHKVGDSSLVERRPMTVARFTGLEFTYVSTWGSAVLHPRLYALARFAG